MHLIVSAGVVFTIWRGMMHDPDGLIDTVHPISDDIVVMI